MNKYVAIVIKYIFPKELPKPLGRWRMEQNSKQLKKKIDLSNEDHCGPCGQYALSKMRIDKKSKPNKIIDQK